MASRLFVYFAGMGTVIAAFSVGFAGALMLTYTTPTHKESPAAFAKRESPVEPAPPVALDAPAQADESLSTDPMAGLAPPITALPIPRADAVSRALASNPPSADPAPSVALAPTSKPAQTDGNGGAEDRHGGLLRAQKRQTTSQKPPSATKEVKKLAEPEEALEAKTAAENFKGETDRAIREGF